MINYSDIVSLQRLTMPDAAAEFKLTCLTCNWGKSLPNGIIWVEIHSLSDWDFSSFLKVNNITLQLSLSNKFDLFFWYIVYLFFGVYYFIFDSYSEWLLCLYINIFFTYFKWCKFLFLVKFTHTPNLFSRWFVLCSFRRKLWNMECVVASCIKCDNINQITNFRLGRLTSSTSLQLQRTEVRLLLF